MNPNRLAAALLLSWLLAGPVRADVLLGGNQHIGDNEDGSFTPRDPVTLGQMQTYPSRFHLSQNSTLTAVRFDGAVSLDNQIEGIWIDNVKHTGLLFGNLYSFLTPVTLNAGFHTLFPDAGCRDAAGLPASSCPAAQENDISFSSLTLISAQTTTSRMLNRRRNVGDDTDADDNYDRGAGGSRWYPDASEGLAIDIPFNIDANRTLTQLRFTELRDVDSSNPLDPDKARVLIDGTFVGNLLFDSSSFVLLPNLSLAAGSHTLRVESGTISSGNRDTISWDDIIMQFSASPGTVPGSFNAVDVGASASAGVIHTKVAGTAVDLDLIALDAARTSALAGYAGTVTVELLDASNDAGRADAYGCRTSWVTVATLGSYTFPAASSGRLTVSLAYANRFLRVARLRVSDPVQAVEGCSTDAFALRPASFELFATDDDALTAGTGRTLDVTSATGTPSHRAGQPFTLRAHPRNAAATPVLVNGYEGSPTATASASVTGAQLGALTPGSWYLSGAPAVARTDTANYSEAGAFTLSVSDDQFASIDATDGSTLAEREIPAATLDVGRFTPDHFSFVSRAAQLAPACGTFSYEGQPIAFSTAPQFVLQAVSAAGTPTLNYTGSLFRLDAATLTDWSFGAINGSDAGAVTLSPASATPTALDSGLGRVTLNFPGASLSVVRGQPRGPIDLEVQLAVASLGDADGIAYSDPEPLRIGQAVNDQGIAFGGGDNQVRYGRMFVQNAYGPELQPLDVSFGTEYAASGGGFTRNLADSCTTAAAPVLSGALASATSVLSIDSPLVAGLGNIRLAAPTGGVTGSVSLRMTPASWLLGDADNDTIYDDPIDALASFGLFRERDRQIYLRETYR